MTDTPTDTLSRPPQADLRSEAAAMTPKLGAIRQMLFSIARDLEREATGDAERQVAGLLLTVRLAIETGTTAEMLAVCKAWNYGQLVAMLAAQPQDDQAREDAIGGLRLPDSYSGIGG